MSPPDELAGREQRRPAPELGRVVESTSSSPTPSSLSVRSKLSAASASRLMLRA